MESPATFVTFIDCIIFAESFTREKVTCAGVPGVVYVIVWVVVDVVPVVGGITGAVGVTLFDTGDAGLVP